MEELSLHELSLFIQETIYAMPEEVKPYTTANPRDHVSLVQDAVADEDEVLQLEYEGNFEKGVLIAYAEPQLPADLHSLLFKILAAVGCSIKDIALINGPAIADVNTADIINMNPSKVIIFGKIKSGLMGLKKKPYEIQNEDGIEFLFSDELQQIEDDKSLKRLLWNELQVLFDIKKK